MAVPNESVLLLANHYVKALQDVRVDENPKWFPPHEDKLISEARSYHERLGEFWPYGKVR